MNRTIACVVMWSVLAVLVDIGAVWAVETKETTEVAPPREAAANRDQREQREPAAVRVIEGDVKIDVSKLKSAAWKTAIRKATEYPYLRAGGQVTLLRVLFEDRRANPSNSDFDEVAVVVNGVRLFLPEIINRVELAAFFESPEPIMTAATDSIQLSSIKLVRFADFPNGGGMYQELAPGEFVLVEHINSTRREADRDPVAIGSYTHQQAKISIPVPPRGQLGIAGDLILRPAKPDSLGRIIAEVVSKSNAPREVQHFRIGPEVVGGRYGRTYEFDDHGVCSTEQLSPGQYRILLPDFDMAKSRWNVTVRPGEVTYLRFTAISPKQVRLDHEKHIAFDAEN